MARRHPPAIQEDDEEAMARALLHELLGPSPWSLHRLMRAARIAGRLCGLLARMIHIEQQARGAA
jgi:hypothetical protein